MSLPTLLDTITRSMGAGSREHSISTIDTLKGVSLIAMFHTHFAWAWRATDWYSLLRFEWYTTDFVSTATLLTMSLVGSMVGIQARREFGDESMYTRRKLLRMSFLFLVGELMNLMFLPALGPFHALVWNALTGIAFFSLLLPLAMRLPPVARLAFAAALALLYFPIVDWLMVPMNQAGITPNAMRLSDLQDIRTLIYFLFFNHAMMVPPYTWAIAMLVTSVVFQGITSPAAFKSPDRFTRELKRVAMAGACLIAIGISTGAFLMKDYDAKVFNELFLPGAVVLWPFKEGMLGFLVRHTPQAIMYQIGIVYVWFACLGWLQVLRKRALPLQEKVNNVGRYTLTAYVLTHVAMLVPVQMPLWLFYVVLAPCLVLFINGLWAWNSKYKGIGTLEFAMEAHAQAISSAFDKKRTCAGG